MDFCLQCSKIPFRTLFGSSRKPRQHSIGNLDTVKKNSSSCKFCYFLLESYSFAYDHAQREELEANKRVRFGFQILPRPDANTRNEEEPWFERAGIAIEQQAGPAIWLRFTAFRETCIEVNEPLVCVSLVPITSSSTPSKGIVPRRRGSDEAISSYVDYSEITEWLSICAKTHSGLCKRPSTEYKRRAINIRLIDTKDRRIRSVTDDTPYIALSYVWGHSFQQELKEFWESVDPESKDLPFPTKPLPHTWEDCIKFCGDLGYQYVWIDALCINQHNQGELQSQLAIMHIIYECAAFTVAAMDGDDADAGLCGVSRPFEKTQQPQIYTGDGELVATYVFDVWSNQGLMPWEQRGWTLQELLLSCRAIFLDKNYPTMRCQSGFFTSLIETDANINTNRQMLTQSDKYFWENGFDVRMNDVEWSFLQYDSILANYTRRKLTDTKDILYACMGIFNQMTINTGMSFQHGMPIADLHRALLWKPHHLFSIKRRPDFPTWSWTEWGGRIEHHYCLDELEAYEKEGISMRTQTLKKSPRHVSFEHQDVLVAEEAYVAISSDSVLQAVSHSTVVSGRKVRSAGKRMNGMPRDSEQGKRAVGDQWVLLKNGGSLKNEIGEVARFEPIDYSFQVHPSVSKWIEENGRQFHLIYIRYFPSLRDRQLKDEHSWRFDYVGCLVLLKSSSSDRHNRFQRIGFVFMTLGDWISFNLQVRSFDVE